MYGMQQLHHQVQSKLFTHKISQALYKAIGQGTSTSFSVSKTKHGGGGDHSIPEM